jgi:UMF1 family MFS transporter
LFFADPGDIWFAVGLIVVSNTGFMLSESFCASFLPELATPSNMGKISGLGWGIGYLGGLVSVFIARQVIITADPAVDSARYLAQNQQAMLAIGAFFLVAALPTFLLVRNRSRPAPGFERASIGLLLRAGFDELRQSVRTARGHPVLFQFLVAFMVYMGGVDAIVKFVGIYAQEDIGLSGGEFVTLFLFLQISAVVGAIGFGYLEGWLGPKRTVMVTLVWWIAGVLGIYFLDALSGLTGGTAKQLFFGLGLFAGAGIGAVQASSRTVVGLLSPKDRSAQMFGFWGMFMRLGSILGVGFGYVADAFGTRRAGVLLVLVFFGLGLILLSRVDIDRGVRQVSPS